jgi:hypothetical protein
MPEILEVIGGNKTKIHCQATICRKCHWLSKWVWLSLEIKKALKYSAEVLFVTTLEQMSKCTATDLDRKTTKTQYRLSCELKKCQVSAGRVLLPQWYGQEEPLQNQLAMSISMFLCSPMGRLQWCVVRWPGKPSHRPAPSNPAIYVSCCVMFSPLTCDVIRSPILLEAHVSPECKGDFLQKFW